MNKEDFFELIKEIMTLRYSCGYSVYLKKVKKNNGVVLTAIVIMKQGNNIAPSIYLDDFYECYKREKKNQESERVIDEICDMISKIYENNSDGINFDYKIFSDYEKIKSKIVYRLLNFESNKDMLRDIPYKRFLDLVIVFCVLIDDEVVGNGSVLIKKEHTKAWKVSEDDLYEQATINTPNLLEYSVVSMESVLYDMMGESPLGIGSTDEYSENNMYLLTNNRKQYGATCMLYSDVIKRISEKLSSNLFIIPSSIHELIIIPQNAFSMTKEQIMNMVIEINKTEVDKIDILSDNVYEYLIEEDRIV